jgi:hypothetical protein
MSNVKFHYLYRDGSNYKKWAELVFSNADGLSADVITRVLRDAFLEDGLSLPTKFVSPRCFSPPKTSLRSMTTASTSSPRSRPPAMPQTTHAGARSASSWKRPPKKRRAVGARSTRRTGCFRELGDLEFHNPYRGMTPKGSDMKRKQLQKRKTNLTLSFPELRTTTILNSTRDGWPSLPRSLRRLGQFSPAISSRPRSFLQLAELIDLHLALGEHGFNLQLASHGSNHGSGAGPACPF